MAIFQQRILGVPNVGGIGKKRDSVDCEKQLRRWMVQFIAQKATHQ